MKFFHLSDLHIGLKLMNRDLREDQEYILDEITELARRERPDAVVIAGDIYDKAVPSAEAVEVFDHFLVGLTEAVPDAVIMMISGNHDSAPRVNCFRKVLSGQNIYMVGQPPRTESEYIEKVTLNDAYGEMNFYLLPFVKPSMVKQVVGVDENGNNLSYNETLHRLIGREKINSDERNVLVSHQFYLPSGKNAEDVERMDSEMRTVGNIDEVSADVLEKFDYAALGHIHKPEIIFEDLMAYAGSLEPLDHTETGYHGLIEGEISEEKKQITSVPFAKRMYTQVEVMISDEMSALEIVDRVETELSYRGRENIYEIVLTGSIDPQIHLDFYEITSQYMVTDIIYETRDQWEYEQLSEEDDFIIQKVADILKDEPEALRYAMEALTYAREK